MFSIGGYPYNEKIFKWIDDHKDLHEAINGECNLVVFKKMYEKVIMDDMSRIAEMEKDIPSLEMHVYDPMVHFDYDKWYENEVKRIDSLKSEHEEKVRYINQLKSKNTSNVKADLRELTIDQYLRLVRMIVDTSLSLYPENYVDHLKFTPSHIEKEWTLVKRHGFYLMLNEGLHQDLFIDLSEDLFNNEHWYLNLKFSFFMYYQFKIVDKQLELLNNVIENAALPLEKLTMYHHSKTKMKIKEDFIRDKIMREEDLNDFIIDAMLKFAEEVITDDHVQLAIYQTTKNFKKSITKHMAWQVIYKVYFDKCSEKFTDFFENFKNLCVIYFCKFYVRWDLNEKLCGVPFYGFYLSSDRKKITYNILDFFKVNVFEEKEEEIYGQYMDL